MSKIIEEEKNRLKLRAKKINLDPLIAHDCYTDEQQDIMLSVCLLFREERDVYVFAKEAYKKFPYKNPYKEHEKAKDRLLWLQNYYDTTEKTFESSQIEKLINALIQPSANLIELKNLLRERALFIMNDGDFSKSQKQNLLTSTFIWFKELEPSFDKFDIFFT